MYVQYVLLGCHWGASLVITVINDRLDRLRSRQRGRAKNKIIPARQRISSGDTSKP